MAVSRVFHPEKDPSFHPARIQEHVESYWNQYQVPQKHLVWRQGQSEKVFFDGPPFITGLPHYGHLLCAALKDIFARFWSMKGFHVPRRAGWDCHGVPIELQAQKELGNKPLSLKDFNNYCRSLLQVNQSWLPYMSKLGRWADFQKPYFTASAEYMDALWEVHHALWEKGLIKSHYRVMPYSPALNTSLSNFEAALDYRDVQDPALYVAAQIKTTPSNWPTECFVLIWTTTPWTLPANTAIAVHPVFSYVLIQWNGKGYILSEEAYTRLGMLFEGSQVLSTFPGAQLHHMTYESFFCSVGQHQPRIVYGDFIESGTGTGLVHIAGVFGEDDFRISEKEHLPLVDHLDHSGCVQDERFPEWQGVYFKDLDRLVIKDLKEKGLLVHQEQFRHNYPHCWRSGQPLLYRAIQSWFISVESLQKDLLEVNQQINWVPDHIREGRFGKWLEQVKDWNYARSRFWGTPIPIWRSEDGSVTRCIRNKTELERLCQQSVPDLHPEYVNEMTFVDPETGLLLKRIPEVFDCWFESGAMPYAQDGQGFSLHGLSRSYIPADFIVEGIDQTRGWFYTLTVLSTALFHRPPSRNIVVCGLILAADGKKMSKSLKNYHDPFETMSQYGGDALRLVFSESPASLGEAMRFQNSLLMEATKQILIPFWNSYIFFTTYAELEGENIHKHLSTENSPTLLDEWILAKLESLTLQFESSLSRYQVQAPIEALSHFLDDLNNWYIRRNRARFWNSDPRAFRTLYEVLIRLCQIAAPCIPFITEYIYQKLTHTGQSLHLTDYPSAKPLTDRQKTLIDDLQIVRKVVKLVHNLRVKHGLRVKFPLRKIYVSLARPEWKERLMQYEQDLLAELNSQSLEWIQNPSQFAKIVVKPNFARLGQRLGSSLKTLQVILKDLEDEKAYELFSGGTLTFEDQILVSEDFEFRFQPLGDQRDVAFDFGILCALDTSTTPEQIYMGWLRELLSEIQKQRKESQFKISDRISLCLDIQETTESDWPDFLRRQESVVAQEVLASHISWSTCDSEKSRTILLKSPDEQKTAQVRFSIVRL